MVDLASYLAELPPNASRCTACGTTIRIGRVSRKSIATHAPILSFTLNGCVRCGHLMTLATTRPARLRDLTRAEAEELRGSTEWAYVRGVVDHAVRKLWG